MKLYRLRFQEISQEGNSQEALNYARKHISVYADSCLDDDVLLTCAFQADYQQNVEEWC